MIGLMRGMKTVSYQSRPVPPDADALGQEPGEERDAEEDQHRPGDLPDRDLEALGVEPEPARQKSQIEVAEERVGDDLEDRVEGDEHGRTLAVAAGEIVPDKHHRDAAGEADDDHPRAVLGLVGQEQPGEREHEQRAEDPVEPEGGDEQPPFGAKPTELVVPNLRQDRVHHQQQPDGDREADGADPQLVEPVVQLRDQ